MKRVPRFTASVASTDFIARLNDVVALGEGNLDIVVERQRPVVLVVGAPRSGTTVLMQWLDRNGFACPSNLAARFPRNPYFAGLLQRLLTDRALDFRDELAIPPGDPFSSDYGKTRGPLSPHEFSFFFRQHFPVTYGEPVGDAAACDTQGFVEGLQRFAAAMERPVALKGLLIQYAIGLFAPFGQVFFLHVHRDEADNVCSLLRHREIVAGDAAEWISVRPPQYAWLKDLAPVEQVAGQVHFTNAEIRRQAALLPPGRVLSVSHERFCAAPAELHARLGAAFAAAGFAGPGDHRGPDRFELRRYDSTAEGYRAARAAIDRVAGGPAR